METFAAARGFVESPGYTQARADALAALDLAAIDYPIVDLISEFTALPYCFTLQCCYGHFVCTSNQDRRSCDSIPHGYVGSLRYRIAYIAFCIKKSSQGRALREALSCVPEIAPDYIQFGSPDWFWEQWVNSYALQVEPTAHQYQDEITLEITEAHHVQEVRELFFERLRELAHGLCRKSHTAG